MSADLLATKGWVATFSAAQRDAILEQLEVRRRSDPAVEDFFVSDGAEPFFVKSLENVQGDQRDVVFISIGYANDRNGVFVQNFGPLNRDGGHRRLNVLISRAATACEVFTSIKSDAIDPLASGSKGVSALKAYLEFAETCSHGRNSSPRSTESTFEQQVAKVLRENGLKVDCSVGFGAGRIGLAICDPDNPRRYLIGVDCDGIEYHKAKWVRDRDRIRLKLLQERGWIMHQVWCLDWFQRPEEQLRRLMASLERAKAICHTHTVVF